MRTLSPEFMAALGDSDGMLNPILARVHIDDTLDLEIRDDYINVYYRGGNLLKIDGPKKRYAVSFDVNYAQDKHVMPSITKVLDSPSAVADLIAVLPELKQLMDFFFASHRSYEREYQQLIVRENNQAAVGKSSDYYICDIEYANSIPVDAKTRKFRFDMVAAHWPSISTSRKNGGMRRLVIVEVKYGDNALRGSAGLKKHLEDVELFLSDDSVIEGFKTEMRQVFNQKRKLGLIKSNKDDLKELTSFSDEKPMLLLILANHDPDSTILRDELALLQVPDCFDLRFAMSNYMGYGLYDEAIVDMAGLKALSAERVCTKQP